MKGLKEECKKKKKVDKFHFDICANVILKNIYFDCIKCCSDVSEKRRYNELQYVIMMTFEKHTSMIEDSSTACCGAILYDLSVISINYSLPHHPFAFKPSSAAACSARCLLLPEPSAIFSSSKNTAQVKVLSWSGPSSEIMS